MTSIISIHLAMRSVPTVNDMKILKALILFIFFIPSVIFSQPSESQLKKFSPLLQNKWKGRPAK